MILGRDLFTALELDIEFLVNVIFGGGSLIRTFVIRTRRIRTSDHRSGTGY